MFRILVKKNYKHKILLNLNYIHNFSIQYGITRKIQPITLYLIETPFNAFANRADPNQAALVRAA